MPKLTFVGGERSRSIVRWQPESVQKWTLSENGAGYSALRQ
jgi:hypothetical protein